MSRVERPASAQSVDVPDGVDAPELPEQSSRRRWLERIDLRTQLLRGIVLVVALAVWNTAVEREWVKSLYAATPRQTLSSLRSLIADADFWSDLTVTLREALVGWAIGSATGVVVGIMLGRWIQTRKVLGPYLTFVNAVPKIALAPIMILWFGVGESSKVVLAALVVFFIVQVPTTSAVELTDLDVATVATTLGATEAQKFVKVYLPGTLPPVLGALRLGAVYALLAVVFGEFLAARRGLGQRLITATNQFNMDDAFALMIVLAALALGINGGIGLVERRSLRWRSSAAQSVVSL